MKIYTTVLAFMLYSNAYCMEELDINESLMQAVNSCDYGEVKRLLSEGAKVNKRDQKGYTLLHQACRYIYIANMKHENLIIIQNEIVKALLNNKALIDDQRNSEGSTPLHIAIDTSLTLVKTLVEAGANLYLEDNEGRDALTYADNSKNYPIIKGEGWKIFEYLEGVHKHKKKTAYTKKEDEIEPLGSFEYELEKSDSERQEEDKAKISKSKVQKKEHVREKKIIKEILDTEWDRFNFSECFKLLERCPDPKSVINKGGNEGLTLLHKAARANDEDSLKKLLKMGANVQAKDRYGATAIHWGAQRGSKNIINLLKSAGADVNGTDDNGYVPLHYAAGQNNIDTIKTLIDKGADPQKRNKNNDTPLDNFKLWHGTAGTWHEFEAYNLLNKHSKRNSKSKHKKKSKKNEKDGSSNRNRSHSNSSDNDEDQFNNGIDKFAKGVETAEKLGVGLYDLINKFSGHHNN